MIEIKMSDRNVRDTQVVKRKDLLVQETKYLYVLIFFS